MFRRLAKEEHGITDEQLDDMEQADLITWLRAQQQQLPPLEDMKFGKLVRYANCSLDMMILNRELQAGEGRA